MKENKESQIKVRITQKEKDKIAEYCKINDLTLSQFLRLAIKEYFNKGEN